MVIMGVSGSGKSTVGELLGHRLAVPFIDGDDLHPAANKEKMRAGIPLDDDDRRPWLQEIGRTLQAHQQDGQGVIVACSALKAKYRAVLASHAPSTVFVHLVGTRELIAPRQSHRTHEYMPNSLLDSQFATLEDLSDAERGIEVSIDQKPEEIVQDAAARLAALHATPFSK